MDVELGSGADGAPRRLAPQIESTVYRIVQEALSNAVKHADAGNVDVQVVTSNGRVELMVHDDGAGFDPSEPSSGFGLVGIRERAALVRGEVTIESAPGSGTTVRATLPTEGEAT